MLEAHFRRAEKLIIGKFCAFARDVKFIMNGAIIASKSVFVNDIEPPSIVVGNPAKVIRKRFDIDVIDLLQSIKWWDWSVAKIT